MLLALEIKMYSLSQRDIKVIELITEGLNNKEIAAALGTTEHTVKNYVKIVFDKAGMGSRLELTLWYLHKKELINHETISVNS